MLQPKLIRFVNSKMVGVLQYEYCISNCHSNIVDGVSKLTNLGSFSIYFQDVQVRCGGLWK